MGETELNHRHCQRNLSCSGRGGRLACRYDGTQPIALFQDLTLSVATVPNHSTSLFWASCGKGVAKVAVNGSKFLPSLRNLIAHSAAGFRFLDNSQHIRACAVGPEFVRNDTLWPTIVFQGFLKEFPCQFQIALVRTRDSSTSPSWSTTRPRQCILPFIFTKTSSKDQF